MDEQKRTALVAGATRGGGRGIAVALGEAGMTVYCTGRSTRRQRSEYDRPETIEETAELVTAAGGRGIAVPVDHLHSDQVERLVDRIDAEQGRLDVLVQRHLGWRAADRMGCSDLAARSRRRAANAAPGVGHPPITSHYALRLLTRRPGGMVVEVTDGTRDYNDAHYRLSVFYDMAKTAVTRLAWRRPRSSHPMAAVSLTPGWMRSEMMLEAFGVTEATWRQAAGTQPHFAAISESPRFVGRAVAALANDPDRARHNGRSLSSGGLAQEYGFTDLDGSRPDCWRYLVEVQEPDATGYR